MPLPVRLLLVFACVAFVPSCDSVAPLRTFEDGVLAVSYSGFRAGQHPDRGKGANNPSRAECWRIYES